MYNDFCDFFFLTAVCRGVCAYATLNVYSHEFLRTEDSPVRAYALGAGTQPAHAAFFVGLSTSAEMRVRTQAIPRRAHSWMKLSNKPSRTATIGTLQLLPATTRLAPTTSLRLPARLPRLGRKIIAFTLNCFALALARAARLSSCLRNGTRGGKSSRRCAAG